MRPSDGSCIVAVFKVNADPDLDNEDIVIPTSNMYGSAEDDENDNDDDGFDDF